ncbi:hypothetical protein [Micromonospora sp. NPDC005174]|uniref:hypothetical protein n=1 Tax=Micromonospora sp. NPDC005174 TaxID=3157018 RepID=UPI0033B4F83C
MSQVSGDGTVFSAFTDKGATHAALPDGGVAAISYAGDGSTWSFDDGSRVSYDGSSHVVSQVSADGTVFSAFTDKGPTHAALPDGGVAAISYAGDGSTWSFDDGSKVSYDGSSHVTSQVSGDGTVFSGFDAQSRPTHAALPDGGAASIGYGPKGSVWSFDDGSKVSYDGSSHVISQVSADGTVFNAFTDVGPTHAALPNGGAASISYAANGGSVWSYTDGSRVSYDGSNHVTSQVAADGTVLSAFTDQGPTHAVLPNGGGVAAIAYAGDGSTWSFDDGSRVSYDGSDHVVSQVAADGTVLSAFTDQGPTHAVLPNGGGAASISYGAKGGSVWSFDDGSRVSYDGSNHVTSQVAADGTVLSAFTDQGPTHAVLPNGGGVAAIAYAGDGSTWSFDDGSRVSYDGSDHVVSQVAADGTVLSAFTHQGPTHAVLPNGGGAASISYGAKGGSVWSYDDGSKVLYDGSDHVVSQVAADGTVLSDFTDQGPTHAVLPNGATASISYGAKGGSTWSHDDGSKVSYDGSNRVASQVAADGTVLSAFTDKGPTHAVLPNGGTAAISYGPKGGSVWSYADGSKVSYDGSNRVTSQVAADGTVFSAFTDKGPTHAALPNGGAATISYGAKGGSVWSYADGSKVSYNSSGHVTSQVSADGTAFSRFDSQGRPTHATMPGPGDVTVSYTSNGASTWSYADGTRVQRNADGAITRETTSDGTVFDRFDSDGRPVHGRVPGADGQPPQTVTIAYKPNGESTWTYHDPGGGTTMTLTRSASGQPLTMVQDGWTFRSFDGDGRPTAGNGPDGSVAIKYGANGTSTWTFTDAHNGRTVIERNAGGQPITMISDGWTYTKFDGEGRPLVGHKPGENGGAGETVTISYGHDDSSVWKYGDGTVITRAGNGRVTSLVADGWTYTKFDDQGRPTYGTKDGKHISISYQGDWTVTRYPDGTTIGTDSHGRPIYQINPDGSRFEFRVEIPKLLQAKNVVAAQAGLLDGHLANLKTQAEAIFDAWQSPAGRQYEAVVGRITAVSNDVQSILHDSVVALGKAYDQYVAAEGGNLKNLTPVNFNSDGSATPR